MDLNFSFSLYKPTIEIISLSIELRQIQFALEANDQ